MFVIYFLISFGASVLGAISGIGGGVIIKPVLDSLSPFSVSTISFLSGCTVLAMSTSTLIRSRKSPIQINKKVSSLLAAGGIIGGLLGKYSFDLIRDGFGNDRIIGISQSALLIILTIFVFVFTLKKEFIKPLHKDSIPFCLISGLLLGSIASFLGIGGGPINLAVLYFFFSMNSKTAALNSIFIIFFSQISNLIFTIMTGHIPEFNTLILLFMMGGGIGGAILGSLLSKKMEDRTVDKLFMGVMILIIFISTYNMVDYIY